MPNQFDLIQRRHSTRHLPKLNKSILKFILLIVIFAIATPALADYLGPDRVKTETVSACKAVLYECRYVPAKDDWRYKRVQDWSCSNESKPWQVYPSQPSSQGCFDGNPGDQYWEKEETLQEVITTYPPATISSSLQNCTLNNGWCSTSPQLFLGGNEPVSGYSINLIEGTLNGQTFACSGANCSVPLNEGNNSFTYWALSTWGDSSTMGAFNAKVDTQLPNITGAFSGTLGSNGWYITPVSFSGNASDATSGLASFTCTLDGIALGSCNSISVNSEGPHTIVLTAQDNAGRTNTLNQNASLDIQNPVLNAALSGTLGANTWYTTAMLHASASDPTPGSGLVSLDYNLDNSNWITFPLPGVLNMPDGKHSLDVRAVDTAGRTVSSSKSFWLDSTAPNVMLNPTGTLGLNDWYTTSLNLTAFASDATSGMDVFEYSLNSSAWTTYTPLSLHDGTHSLSFWGQDHAGLATQVDHTYNVDTRAPQIGGSLSGVPGTNGWYISDVTLSASASDPMPGSGADAFTYVLNGGAETSYIDALILSEGQHTIQLNAVDKAGWTHSTEQIIKVDTIYPFLNIQTTLPNWIKDSVALYGSAGDNGSGLLKVEISTDGGQIWQSVIGTTSWGYTWNTQNSSNGIHDVQVRAIDNAGLTTKRSFNTGVDNRAPKISVPDSWFQWDSVTLDIWDDDSGLSEARVEISDPEGRWPTRIIRLNPGRFPLDFKWDRRFADDTIAPLGTYNIKVVAFDNLGNPTRTSASINILLGILPAGPTATPQPSSRLTSTPTANQNVTLTANPMSSHMGTQPAVVSIFGIVEPTSQATPTPKTSPIPRATPTQTSVLDWLQSIFIPSSDAAESVIEVVAFVPLSVSQSSSSQAANTQSPVLWGAVAAGLIGAVTAYALEEKRKRKEEEARQAAQVRAEVEAKNVAIQASQQAKREAMKIQNWLEGQAILNAQIEEAKKQGVNKRTEQKEAQLEEEMKARDAKPQEWKSAYNNYMTQKAMQDWRAGEKETYIVQPKEKTSWQKALDWIDNHQAEIALGIGIVVGVGAVLLTGGLALPALAVIAGAVALAGGTVAVGTVALNVHYNRQWNENLVRNIAIAGIAAGAVTGVGLLYNAVVMMGTSACALNSNTCNLVAPILKTLDAAEEIYLDAKLAYQKWRGDEAGAAETYFDLYSEHADGGVPGNFVLKELSEQLAGLSQNAVYLLTKHGTDIIPLLLKHGDEALDIIRIYGDDGIAFLQKYGDDAIQILQTYGKDAIPLLKAYGVDAFRLTDRLTPLVGGDAFKDVLGQGPEAVAALSHWSDDELKKYGDELVARAATDAKALDAASKLAKIKDLQSPEAQELLKIIAENSIQGNADRLVLGKWVDGNFDEGFIGIARADGSSFYGPNRGLDKAFEGLSPAEKDKYLWAVNQQALQEAVDSGLKIDYSFDGLDSDSADQEIAAIKAIASGNNQEVVDIFGKIPFRMREIEFLVKQGYTFEVDTITNIVHWIEP